MDRGNGMTHDELLKIIIHGQTMNYEWRNALRAVVELHKPFRGDECRECGYLGDFPCPTIQAIEKELE